MTMPTTARPRILLADDHMLVAEACKRVLEPEFEVIAIVVDGRALVSASAELKPDLIIADVSMPLLNGLDASEQILRDQPHSRIIFLTMNTDPYLAGEAFRRGAFGYILKTSAATELGTAARRVLGGERYLSPLISKTSLAQFLRRTSGGAKPPQLTLRQREVLQLLAEGRVMKEAASILNVATRTVAFHKYRIMETLGLKSNAELVRYAIQNSIISKTDKNGLTVARKRV